MAAPRRRPTFPLAALYLLVVGGCATGDRPTPDDDAGSAESGVATAFIGASLFDGTGADPVDDAVLVVRDGRVAAAGPAASVDIPADAEVVRLEGGYIVPGLINTHGHVGDTRGLEAGHYSRENVLAQLALYARYGITTVASLGGDGPAGVRVRDEEAGRPLDRARLLVAGPVVAGSTPGEATAVVDANAALGVDVIKIRVDDNLGTTAKMPPEVYRAVIDRAHEHGLAVAAHLFYLADAKGLLDAGADFVVHSVRDVDVDADVATLLRERGVCYTPTLTREVSTFAYREEPEFFSDPFFLAEADPTVLDALRDPGRQRGVRESESARRYEEALVQAMENLAALSGAGVTIALGTDSGPPGRFQGYFEHLEMELMADAGLSARQILLAATGAAAGCIERDDIGTLEPGRRADFLVLSADPLEDIRNLRALERVYIGGGRIEPAGAP